MAKRELIDKAEVMMLIDDVFECQCNKKEAYELLDNISKVTVTEQDIVKPYLDKIIAEIIKKHLSVIEKNDFESGRTYGYEEVLEIIDKYEAESEDKE